MRPSIRAVILSAWLLLALTAPIATPFAAGETPPTPQAQLQDQLQDQLQARLQDQLQTQLQTALDQTLAADPSLPGLIAAVHAPRLGLQWSGAAGRAGRDGDASSLSPEHAFRIASVTKVYVAATTLRLVERQMLDLTAPIAPLLSEHTRALLHSGGYAPERISLAQLLGHTSGLFDYASASAFREAVVANPGRRWTRREQIQLAMTKGQPVGTPGQRYSYSDTGYLLLAEILERRSGQPLPALMARELKLGPASQRRTYFERLEPAPAQERRAAQYMGDLPVQDIDPSADLFGGGGLVSTVDELARFFRALLQGQLFEQPHTLATALLPVAVQTPSADAPRALLLPTLAFGRRQCWGHMGFWGVIALYCPDIDVAVALSFNQAMPSASTLGRTPGQPGLLERLAAIVENALPNAQPKQP